MAIPRQFVQFRHDEREYRLTAEEVVDAARSIDSPGTIRKYFVRINDVDYSPIELMTAAMRPPRSAARLPTNVAISKLRQLGFEVEQR